MLQMPTIKALLRILENSLHPNTTYLSMTLAFQSLEPVFVLLIGFSKVISDLMLKRAMQNFET